MWNNAGTKGPCYNISIGSKLGVEELDYTVLRDYVIIIAGGLAIILIILTAVLWFILYRKVNSLTASVKNTTDTIGKTINDVKQTISNAKTIFNQTQKEKSTEERQPPKGSPT